VAVMDGRGPELGVVFTSMNCIELGTGRRLGVRKAQTCHRGRALETLLEGNFVTGPTALIRKECFRKVGMYDSTIGFAPDWELWIRMARCFDSEVISEPLYNYSIHTNQLTANYRIQILGLQRILGLHADLFTKYPKAHAHQLVHLGLLYYHCGNAAQARVCLKRGMICHRLWIRPYKLFLLTFLSQPSFQRLLDFRERA